MTPRSERPFYEIGRQPSRRPLPWLGSPSGRLQTTTTVAVQCHSRPTPLLPRRCHSNALAALPLRFLGPRLDGKTSPKPATPLRTLTAPGSSNGKQRQALSKLDILGYNYETRSLHSLWDKLFIENDVLVYLDSEKYPKRVVLPI
ncbi:unnamed protein product [Schistocephalus solidus]|uniref:Uncharacterized protein n=1 Tax=Schistocephalus solidus TaxID=70667 RepID=A0A183S9G5_SCHSO|nr:unnamed protein product [Schistocephalus solidus]